MTKTIDIWLDTQQFSIMTTLEANKQDKIQTKLHAPTIIIILLCIFRVRKKTNQERSSKVKGRFLYSTWVSRHICSLDFSILKNNKKFQRADAMAIPLYHK